MSNKNIVLETPMTYAGVNYEAGENEMPEDAAKYALSRKFGEKYDSVEKIQAISLEDLIALDGITEPSAKKALEYKREGK